MDSTVIVADTLTDREIAASVATPDSMDVEEPEEEVCVLEEGPPPTSSEALEALQTLKSYFESEPETSSSTFNMVFALEDQVATIKSKSAKQKFISDYFTKL